MLGSTFTIPHTDGNIVCVKINQDVYSSEYMYRDEDHEVRVKIRHQQTKGGKDRHNVEISETVFETTESLEIARKMYVVLEQAPNDVDVKMLDALADWLIASANANISSLLGWES